MKKKSYFCFCLSVVLVLLTSCWDRKELNELAILVGMGFDKKEDKVHVTTQIVNPSEVASSKGGGGYSTPVSILNSTNSTIFEALRKLAEVSPRKIYFSHLRILVIGEDLAREGISQVLDGISRNQELRTDFYVVVAKGTTAENVLGIMTPIEKIPANKMYNTLENAEESWAPTVKVQLDKLISDISNPTKDAVLTGITIIGDEEIGKTSNNLEGVNPLANLKYSGIAILKDDKLIDWLDEKESKGYNYIVGNVKNTVGLIPCPDKGNIVFEVIRTKSKIKGSIYHGKPKIIVNIFAEGNIGEVKCKIDLLQPKTVKEIEKLGRNELTMIIESAIKKAKDSKADIFGFGDAIEDAEPKEWQKLKKDWEQQFVDLEVTVNVDLQIRRLGTTTNAVY